MVIALGPYCGGALTYYEESAGTHMPVPRGVWTPFDGRKPHHELPLGREDGTDRVHARVGLFFGGSGI